jgi:hypothetical protein
LRKNNPQVALALEVYAAGFTLLHLPLAMNTGLRIPLLEPLVVVLAGAGVVPVGIAPAQQFDFPLASELLIPRQILSVLRGLRVAGSQ